MTEKKTGLFEKLRLVPDVTAGLAIAVIIVLETMQCIGRYAFGHPFLFVDDIVVICFSWAIFVGAAVAYRRKMHYGLEVISNRFKGRAKQWYLLFVQIVTTCLFGYLLYRSIVLFANSGSKILTTTRISFKWVDAGAVVGFALMTIYGIEFIISDLKKLLKKEEEDKA